MHKLVAEIMENPHVEKVAVPARDRIRVSGPHVKVHYTTREQYLADEARIRRIAASHGFQADVTRRSTKIRRIQLQRPELSAWHAQRARLKILEKIQLDKNGRKMAEIMESLEANGPKSV